MLSLFRRRPELPAVAFLDMDTVPVAAEARAPASFVNLAREWGADMVGSSYYLPYYYYY